MATDTQSFQAEDLLRMHKVLRHRLRNFASGIRNAVSLLAIDLADRLQPQEKEYFPLLVQECDELSRLTDRMGLLFEETPAGGEGSVEDAIRTAVERVRRTFPTASVAIRLAEGTGTEKTTRLQHLTLILTELIANSLEEKPGGEVGVDVSRRDAWLVFRVSDMGKGFAPGEAEKVFLAFFTTRPRHLGLGLAIVKRFVEGLGGSVAVVPTHAVVPTLRPARSAAQSASHSAAGGEVGTMAGTPGASASAKATADETADQPSPGFPLREAATAGQDGLASKMADTPSGGCVEVLLPAAKEDLAEPKSS
ncbi:MAG: HAMP domain-containing histidine kinase [Lentisphaerae bacterium]|nr:HAMP domain-containing histidine kinase [Lentisphaerota bacterium]